jgi:hypothetical protein
MVSTFVYRVRAALIAHAVTFSLIMFWSAVQGNVTSYFFAYRFLYPGLYLYGLWILHDADRIDFHTRFRTASFWFIAILSLSFIFDVFYFGYHMIYLTFSACSGQLGPTVCSDTSVHLRYVFTAIGVALLILFELCLLGFTVLRGFNQKKKTITQAKNLKIPARRNY